MLGFNIEFHVSLQSRGPALAAKISLPKAATDQKTSACSYASKLQEQLSLMAADVFPASHDQERIRSVLSDLSKTAADFRDIAARAIDHLATGSLLQLRWNSTLFLQNLALPLSRHLMVLSRQERLSLIKLSAQELYHSIQDLTCPLT